MRTSIGTAAKRNCRGALITWDRARGSVKRQRISRRASTRHAQTCAQPAGSRLDWDWCASAAVPPALSSEPAHNRRATESGAGALHHASYLAKPPPLMVTCLVAMVLIQTTSPTNVRIAGPRAYRSRSSGRLISMAIRAETTKSTTVSVLLLGGISSQC